MLGCYFCQLLVVSLLCTYEISKHALFQHHDNETISWIDFFLDGLPYDHIMNDLSWTLDVGVVSDIVFLLYLPFTDCLIFPSSFSTLYASSFMSDWILFMAHHYGYIWKWRRPKGLTGGWRCWVGYVKRELDIVVFHDNDFPSILQMSGGLW